MALLKSLEQPTGVVADYVKIDSVQIRFAIYKDETARRAGKTPVSFGVADFPLLDLPEGYPAEMYDLLKETEAMQGATDLL